MDVMGLNSVDTVEIFYFVIARSALLINSQSSQLVMIFHELKVNFKRLFTQKNIFQSCLITHDENSYDLSLNRIADLQHCHVYEVMK